MLIQITVFNSFTKCWKAVSLKASFELSDEIWSQFFELSSTICYQIFFFHQMIALQDLWKLFFISSKKLFLFLRYSNFSISVFPSSSPCQTLLKRLIEDNLKVYDIINCLNKNLIIHFVWYLEKEKRYGIETLFIDRVLNKEQFCGGNGENHAENVHQKLIPDLFLSLVINSEQPLDARNSFESKIFWKRIIKES